MKIEYKENYIPEVKKLMDLYKSVGWGHSNCPKAAYEAIQNSTYVVTAWEKEKLIGLGRAISDKTITVYFPDLLINPGWQRKGIGTKIMRMMLLKYGELHNQVLIAEDKIAEGFYKKFNFNNETSALSIYKTFPEENN